MVSATIGTLRVGWIEPVINTGEIVYSRLFSQDIVIINSERVARDLLDRRSHNYSTRPPGLLRVLDLWVLSILYFCLSFNKS